MKDVVVIGAGPAGAAAAICASRRGLRVVLLESGQYPRHKVCGEFVSAEAADVLRYLGVATSWLQSTPRISSSRLHSNGTSVTIRLAEHAYSIPRFSLDEELWNLSADSGVERRLATATSVTHNGQGLFSVATSCGMIQAHSVINASGRWSRFSAKHEQRGDAWIGLKAHFAGEADDAVDLYFFRKGYCGVQAVAPGVLNACALVRRGVARNLGEVFQRQRALSNRAARWKQVTETFATSPVHLGVRTAVRDGILNAGDAAGFVDPFVGDGISLALRSGVLAGRTVLSAAHGEYEGLYRNAFSGIFRASRFVRNALALSGLTRPLLLSAVRFPGAADCVFHLTRASAFDVLSPSLPGRAV